jgi:hypothetical protein
MVKLRRRCERSAGGEHCRAVRQAVFWISMCAVAVAAIAAAPVSASSSGTTIDRTLSCAVHDGAIVDAWATDPRINAAGAFVSTSHGSLSLLAFDTAHQGITVKTPACRAVRRRIPLTRSGLPSAGIFSAGAYEGLDTHCPISGRAYIRLRLHLDSGGTPMSGQLAVWGEAKVKVKTKKGTKLEEELRPLAFAQWSPARTRTYLSSICS